MINQRSFKTPHVHTCLRCGATWTNVGVRAKWCSVCREIVKREQMRASASHSRANVRRVNERLELPRDERVIGGARPTDESHEMWAPSVTVCDAYHNGRPMRSRRAVL